MNAKELLQQEENELVAAIDYIDHQVEQSTKFGNAPSWNKKWKESQTEATHHLLSQLRLVHELMKKLS